MLRVSNFHDNDFIKLYFRLCVFEAGHNPKEKISANSLKCLAEMRIEPSNFKKCSGEASGEMISM